MDLANQELRLILVGNIGCGKTLTADTLLGISSPSSLSLAPSRVCEVRRGEVEGRRLVVVETPRWYWSGQQVEEGVRRETERALGLTAPGPHAFLVLVPVGQFTHMEQRLPEQLERVFGEGALAHALVLLTCGDYLLGRDEEQYVRREDGLMGVVEKCGGRWHVINNRRPHNRLQVVSLLEKVEELAQSNGGCYLQSAVQREVEARVREKERELERRYSFREEDRVELDHSSPTNTPWNGGSGRGSFRGRHREETEEEKVTLQQLANGLHSQAPQSTAGHTPLHRSSTYKLNKEGAILSQITEKSEVRVSNSSQNFITTIHHHITSASEPATAPLQISTSSSSSSSSTSEIRLVLLGRAGSGKSSTGNAILGREEFKTRKHDVSSVVTQQCARGTAGTGSKQVLVVDTPDWLRSGCSPNELKAHVSSCLALCSPGPHLFLLCVPVTRPAHDTLQSLGSIEAAFGPEAMLHRTLVVFTDSELLNDRAGALEKGKVEEHIASKYPEMLELVEQCGDRYHVLQRGSVEELLQKVWQAVKESGGGYYGDGSVGARTTVFYKDRGGEEIERAAPSGLHSLKEEDESEEAVRQKNEEAENTPPSRNTPPPPASSSILRSVLRFTGEKAAAGARRVPKLVAGGALVGGAVGLFFGGPLGGAVGATAGTVAAEVGRRKYSKRKTD